VEGASGGAGPTLASDHGLQIRQWRIADQPQVTAEVMGRFGEPVQLDPPTAEMLRRNGLRLRRVPLAHLEDLMQQLGGASMSVDSWFGQAYQWQIIATAPIRPQPTGVAIDGRTRRFVGGRMELMFRGWTVPMEEGPVMLLELLPRYNRSRASRLDQMLRRRVFEGELFTSMNVELLMEPGWAYLLMFESPSVIWAGQDDSSSAATGSPRSIPSAGPEAVAPLTVGEILLREDTFPPHRQVLLFVPRIPPRAYPPEHPAAGRMGEGGGRS
jgi:hypothetical protein